MSYEVFAFILAILVSIVLIFLVIWNIIAFDDLKTDYKNPVDMCNSLNPLVLPEYAVHVFMILVFLAGGQWTAVMFNIPLLAYHIHRYSNRPMMSTAGLYDPTEVMNASEMWRCQKEGWIKLAFYLISFFFYLYSLRMYTFGDNLPLEKKNFTLETPQADEAVQMYLFMILSILTFLAFLVTNFTEICKVCCQFKMNKSNNPHHSHPCSFSGD